MVYILTMFRSMNSLNPKIINILAKQQAELAQNSPDGKL